MSNILTLGLTAEGPTDYRFWTPILRKTFTDILIVEGKGEIEVWDVLEVFGQGKTYVNKTLDASKKAEELGIMILCTHVDADAISDQRAFDTQILPSLEAIDADSDNLCEIIVPIVPTFMTEALMLADTELIREELGTTKSAKELGISGRPEHLSNPKETLDRAIQIAFADRPRRHRNQVKISDLYAPIGQNLSLKALDQVSSYQKFKSAAREGLKKLNYLTP